MRNEFEQLLDFLVFLLVLMGFITGWATMAVFVALFWHWVL